MGNGTASPAATKDSGVFETAALEVQDDLSELAEGDRKKMRAELAILEESCVQERLPQYFAQQGITDRTAEEALQLVKNVIRGKRIDAKDLQFLRMHISPFINFTKQFPRTLTIPAGHGYGETGKGVRAAIRRIVGKVDPTIWLDQALRDKVSGIQIGELERRRLRDIDNFLEAFGMDETARTEAKTYLEEKVRRLAHGIAQDYEVFKRLVKNMLDMKVTSLGIDFSDVIETNWHPTAQELASLLSQDMEGEDHGWHSSWTKEAFLTSVAERNGGTSKQQIRNALMLAAMRKTGFGYDIMKPVSLEAIIGENTTLSAQRASAEVFLYDKESSGNLEKPPFPHREGSIRMAPFSEWATNAIARAARGLPLPDNMSTNDPKNESSMPQFTDREILPLTENVRDIILARTAAA